VRVRRVEARPRAGGGRCPVKAAPDKCLCADCIARDPRRAQLRRKAGARIFRTPQRTCPDCGRVFERVGGVCSCGGSVAAGAS